MKKISRKRGRPQKSSTQISAKEQILITALKLFYLQGINNVAVDKIISDAGIAKMTFFKHFPTKKHLVLEVLKSRDEQFFKWLDSEVNKSASRSKKKLEVFIDLMGQWFATEDFRGCAFINTVAEMGKDGEDEKFLCVTYKEHLLKYLTELAKQDAYKSPGQLAELIMTVLDGATVRAQMTGAKDGLQALKKASKILLQANL